MKKSLSIIMILCMCIALTACSSGTISGDPQTYTNPDQSFSIDLPTSEENGWVVNEEAAGGMLDITDESDTVRVQVQCMAKSQAGAIATDLNAYKEYSMMNTFSDMLASVALTETEVQVPEAMTGSTAGTFDYKGAKGLVVFMESERCYYTYLALAVKDAYSVNEAALMESILSLKELTATQ